MDGLEWERGWRVTAEVDSAEGCLGDCGAEHRSARHALGHACTKTRRGVAIIAISAGALLLQSSPALAVSQRGHEFSFRFGAFSEPTGVAVDDASGDVYVADAKKKRIDAFEPVVVGGELSGEVESKSWETTAVPSPQAVAVDNSGKSTDPSSGDIYVVSNEKAIYKLDPEGKEVDAIKAPGGSAAAKKFSAIKGVAVDTEGHVFVYQENGKIFRFDDGLTNEEVSEETAPESDSGRPAFAVDAEGDFYIGDQGEAGASDLQSAILREANTEYQETRLGEGEPFFAVVAKLAQGTDQILVPALDYDFAGGVAVNPQDEAANEVDESDDTYVVNVAGAGSEKTSTVAAFAPESGPHEKGMLIQRFSAAGLRDGDAIAVDSKTGAVYVADAASSSNDVDVFELETPGAPAVEGVAAESSVGTAGTEILRAAIDPTGADTDYYFEYGTSPCTTSSACSESSPVNVGEGFGDRAASVELHGLQPGTYYYRAVAQNSYGKVQSVERTFAVVATVSGLPDGRAWELVSPPDKDGAEPEALTREGGVIQAAENGSAITYVADGPMPAGEGVEGNRDPEYPQIFSTRGAKGWSSQDISTPVTQGTGVEVGAPPEYQYFSPNLALALVQPAVGAPESGSIADPPLAPSETQDKTMYLRDQQPIPGAEEFLPVQPGESEKTSYEAAERSAIEGTSRSPGYVALVTALNPPGGSGTEFGGGLQEGVEFVSANADLSDAVLKSWKGERGLYEWTGVGQALKKVSILPEGGALVEPKHAFLGGPESGDSRNAISSNGERVIWTTNNSSSTGSGNDLFVRDTATEETVQLDTFQGVSPQEGSPNANFETANAGGSKIFFTDTRRLTPDSRATERSPNLYVAELEGGEVEGSQLTATLTDLTPQEGAKVQAAAGEGGGLLGAGEEADGELNAYFVADGVLAPGATPGYCRTGAESLVPPQTTCNLYVRRFAGGEWQPTQFIAALSSEDQPDWLSPGEYDDLTDLTSRVSPNGKFLAFMSNRSLTGYDNEDLSSEHANEVRLDEEVYLYDASTGQVSCASCDPTGERPTGVLDTKNAGEGIGLLVSRPTTWELFGVDHWLAGSLPGWTSVSASDALYQSRYLSNEGRLFFNSADALVPLAKPTRNEEVNGEDQQVGVENVYEYEPSGLGACGQPAGCVALVSSGESESESAFLDASATGNDVFFLTAQPISSQDKDSNFDIYDAHVCETSSPCVSPPSETITKCEEEGGEACQPYAPAPGFAAPASATLPGSGNLVQHIQVLGEKESVKPKPKPLTRAQKLAKALKACRKDKKKAKRVKCEKQAHKKYGPAKKKTAKSSEKGAR
jgi:hypothetical protein